MPTDHEQNSHPTGSLRPIAEIMPSTRASMSLSQSSGSRTDTTEGRGGTRRALPTVGSGGSASGVTPRLNGEATHPVVRAFDLPPQAVSLAHSIEQLICWGVHDRYGSHGWEGVTVTGVSVVDGASPAAVRAALDDIERLCAPADLKLVASSLAKLKALTASRAKTGEDMSLTALAYTEELAAYPADVVVAACKAWQSANTWWPSWAELKNECDKRMMGRTQIRDALRRAVQ